MSGMDDAQASVRAVRRKGSWESGESRWSAAAGGLGGVTLSTSYGGGGGGGPGSLIGGYRSLGMRTADRDSVRLGGGGQSVSFSFRSEGGTSARSSRRSSVSSSLSAHIGDGVPFVHPSNSDGDVLDGNGLESCSSFHKEKAEGEDDGEQLFEMDHSIGCS